MCEHSRLGSSGALAALVVSLTRRRLAEQLAHTGDVLGANAAGEQAVMANAMKARRQDMDEEAADELAVREPHDLLPSAAVGAVILVFEGDAVVAADQQAAVGE